MRLSAHEAPTDAGDVENVARNAIALDSCGGGFVNV